MKKPTRSENKAKYALRLLKNEGLAALLIAALQKYQKHKHITTAQKKSILMLVDPKDVVSSTTSTRAKKPVAKQDGKVTLAWVMSPPGASGGGHQNIFRFIKHLDTQGFRNYIYLYSTNDHPDPKEIKDKIKGFYDLDLGNIQWLKPGEDITMGDAIVATGWETAYPVRNATKQVKKFYFVQDFEPYFYPIGSEYVLAENTYKFGFTGITAGGWLAKKLSSEYGMKCYNYDFASEPDLYQLTNKQPRKEVFFYARPITTRRGFELGILTLKQFHEMNPDHVINLAGWDVSEYDIPFPYVNHSALKLEDLSDLYNKCAAGLVISLTNMSLLPLELLACGTIPVVNDGENNRLVSNNPNIKYSDATPDALAKAMDEVVNAKNSVAIANKAANSVEGTTWNASVKKVKEIIEGELHV